LALRGHNFKAFAANSKDNLLVFVGELWSSLSLRLALLLLLLFSLSFVLFVAGGGELEEEEPVELLEPPFIGLPLRTRTMI
jgi:hypothetical protein